jgi:hypothetical protein
MEHHIQHSDRVQIILQGLEVPEHLAAHRAAVPYPHMDIEGAEQAHAHQQQQDGAAHEAHVMPQHAAALPDAAVPQAGGALPGHEAQHSVAAAYVDAGAEQGYGGQADEHVMAHAQQYTQAQNVQPDAG